MYIVPIAWMFVVLLMTLAEATATNGTVLGAFFTFLLYGLLPLSILMYVLGTPGPRRARRKAEAEELAAYRAAQSPVHDEEGPVADPVVGATAGSIGGATAGPEADPASARSTRQAELPAAARAQAADLPAAPPKPER